MQTDAFHVFDTTLRDGAQREGITYSVADKLAVARLLDELGVGFIEGGWPGALPKDTEFFARAAAGELKLRNATLVAFGAIECAYAIGRCDNLGTRVQMPRHPTRNECRQFQPPLVYIVKRNGGVREFRVTKNVTEQVARKHSAPRSDQGNLEGLSH